MEYHEFGNATSCSVLAWIMTWTLGGLILTALTALRINLHFFLDSPCVTQTVCSPPLRVIFCIAINPVPAPGGMIAIARVVWQYSLVLFVVGSGTHHKVRQIRPWLVLRGLDIMLALNCKFKQFVQMYFEVPGMRCHISQR